MTATVALPGALEDRRQPKTCSKCSKPGSFHEGVVLSDGRFLCGTCYRRPLFSANGSQPKRPRR